MADEADISQARIEILEAAGVAAVREAAAKMPAGTPGECELCGEESPRLVNGACARCRDKHKLP
jgi:RNA polymerase-binding transcription factor DksA